MRKGQTIVRQKPAPTTMAMPATFAEQLQLDIRALEDCGHVRQGIMVAPYNQWGGANGPLCCQTEDPEESSE
jgi:hypothetical protein